MLPSLIFTKRMAGLMVLAFFIIHFVLQFSLLLLEFESANVQEGKSVYGVFYSILSFPFSFLLYKTPLLDTLDLNGLSAFIPFFINSLLWSFVVYLFLKDLVKHYDRQNYKKELFSLF